MRYIIVPLYSHIGPREADELAAELEHRFQLGLAPYVVEGTPPPPDEPCPHCGGVNGYHACDASERGETEPVASRKAPRVAKCPRCFGETQETAQGDYCLRCDKIVCDLPRSLDCVRMSTPVDLGGDVSAIADRRAARRGMPLADFEGPDGTIGRDDLAGMIDELGGRIGA